MLIADCVPDMTNSTVHIYPYCQDHLSGMLEAYNAQTAHEPHIAPLTAGSFVALVESKSYFDPSGLFVATQAGRVRGWVHACVAPGTEPWNPNDQSAAQICMLLFPADQLKVGQALVNEATRWLQQSNAQTLLALSPAYGYPFYRGLWLGGEPMGPASLPQVQLALEVGGYKIVQASIFMTAAFDAPPDDVSLPDGVELVEEVAVTAHAANRESWAGFEPMRVQAIADGQAAGAIGWVVLRHVAERLGAACINIWSLSVKEPYRQRGLASALVARALRRGHALDARYASVGTQLWNAPAHATYARFGFVARTMMFGHARSCSASRCREAEAVVASAALHQPVAFAARLQP